jgi:D-alanyl-D-alanine carboxypeptidase
MTYWAKVTALVTAAVVAVPGVAVASPPSDHGLKDVVAIGKLAEVRDGQRVWRGSSGVAELGTTRPVPVNGRFRAGSVTKTFVATVVLQLVGEGRLRLDDSVEKWLPGVVPDGQHISVRQLLNHTSGLYDFVRTIPFPPSQAFFDNRWRTWTTEEEIAQALANPSSKPGVQFSYSNTNYLLLAEIIQKITGHTYAEEIQRRLIHPLHLSGTSMPGTSVSIPGPHLHGYVPSDHGLVDFTLWNPTVLGAAGELISTTHDLNTFFQALLGGHLLKPWLLAEMKKPGVDGATYGLGLAWFDTSCGRVYGNDGDALAYQAYSYSTEDTHHQATIAVTPNQQTNPDPSVQAFLENAICS